MAVLSADTPRPGIDWPSFRGPGARGVAEGAPAPATWDVPDNKNVKWRVAVPGLAHSSPVVWGNQVCTASAVSGKAEPAAQGRPLRRHRVGRRTTTEHQWLVLCFDKATGKHAVAADRAHRRAEGQAPHQVHARQLDAGHRRPLHPRVLRIGGAVRLRHEGEAGLEEGLRPARLRLLHGARRAVGLCQLADHSRRTA